MLTRLRLGRLGRMLATLLVTLVVSASAGAQAPPDPGAPPSASGSPGAAAPATFKPEELQQIAAPIALYPDPLVAQILMASTYPIEIVLAARIGRNELSTIQVCLAYVDAQREYFREPRGADPVLQYAQHLASTPGRHDGLCWETRPDETPSPLGALVARARAEGYRPRTGARQEAAYHSYRYRILTAQGRSAPDGALDYIVGSRMIGGFALVASPLQYGVSGVMTFIVSHAAVVYQKDLGASSAAIALRITRFDPDPSWTKVTP